MAGCDEHVPAARRAWTDFEILNDLDDPYFVMDLTPSKSSVLWANNGAVNVLGLSMDALLRINLNSGNSAATQREFALMYQQVQSECRHSRLNELCTQEEGSVG